VHCIVVSFLAFWLQLLDKLEFEFEFERPLQVVSQNWSTASWP